MARFRRQSRHRKTRGGRGLLYMLLLAGCAFLVVGILTWDLEDTKAVRWMTSQEVTDPVLDIGLYPGGQFGFTADSWTPRWIAATVTRSQGLSVGDTIFHERYQDDAYHLVAAPRQHYLWKELTQQHGRWLSDTARMAVIYGPMSDGGLFVAHHLAGRTMGLRIPAEGSRLPLSHFMMPISELEAGLGIELFRDIVSDESALQAVDKLDWPLDTAYYYERMTSLDHYGRDN